MKKNLIYSIVLLFVCTMFLFPAKSQAISEYYRISGDSRIETAIEISNAGWDESNVVILARADNPADALASAGLSGKKEAPILLTYTNKLPDSVINELIRLDASKVFLLGGTGAISSKVENELGSMGFYTERVAGKNRFETAAQINKEAGLDKGTKGIVVNGFTVADAISASSKAAVAGVPIYLATEKALPVELPESITDVTIYGGVKVVGEEVFNQLRSQGKKVTRLSGENRFDTNIKSLQSDLMEDVIIVRGTSVSATKEDYPDAVTASGLAKVFNANVILSHPTRVMPEVEKHFSVNRYMNIFIIGGESAVSSDVAFESSAFVDTDLRGFIREEILDTAVHPEKPTLYYTTNIDPYVWALNYETGERDFIEFDETPESLYFANGKLYAALLKGEHSNYWWEEDQEGAIAIIDADSFQLEKKFDIALDPYDIVADKEGFIYTPSGSGQHTFFKSYDGETGKEVSSTYIRNQSYIELSPQEDSIYSITTDVSPRDISRYTISNGQLTSYKDSPYHGDYDLGGFSDLTKLRISSDGKFIFNNSGNVFYGNSMNYYTTLRYDYADVLFDLPRNSFLLGRNGLVLDHNYRNFEIETAFSTYGEVRTLHQNQEDIVILTDGYLEGTTLPAFGIEVMSKDRLLNREVEPSAVKAQSIEMKKVK